MIKNGRSAIEEGQALDFSYIGENTKENERTEEFNELSVSSFSLLLPNDFEHF